LEKEGKKEGKEIDFARGDWLESNIQGDEDVRLFYDGENKKRLVCTSVNCDSNPNNPRIATSELDCDTMRATSYKHWDSLGVQKNWLFCARDNEFWTCIDKKGQVCTISDNEKKDVGEFNPLFRFSAGPLPVPDTTDEYIVLIHCVEGDKPFKSRVYYHRFVYIKNKKVVSYSDAFHFEEQRQVEYSCGMGFLNNNQVLVTYSFRDKTSQAGTCLMKDLIRISKAWEFGGDHYKKLKIADGIAV
jgi:hypothetical protein